MDIYRNNYLLVFTADIYITKIGNFHLT